MGSNRRMSPGWLVGHAVDVGTSHIARNQRCQDACFAQEVQRPDGSSVLIAIVADGAGSALYGEEAAEHAVEAFRASLSEAVVQEDGSDWLDSGWFEEQRDRLIAKLGALADERNARFSEFLSTILIAVAFHDVAVFYQIGDGFIVFDSHHLAEATQYEHVSFRDVGEYANETEFVIDPRGADEERYTYHPFPLTELYVFSDGIQRLAIDFLRRKPHAPFMQSLRSVFVGAVGDHDPEKVVQSFLASAGVNARTDDDKSLVIALRRCGPAKPLGDGEPEHADVS